MKKHFIPEWLLCKGKDREFLMRETGMSKSAVDRVCLADPTKRITPRRSNLELIARALKIKTEDLFRDPTRTNKLEDFLKDDNVYWKDRRISAPLKKIIKAVADSYVD